ncbi:MAG: ROK family transcriptional regulator [Brachymonas sp.]|nr:ROK family transcriptional regulator [Brachymonas sp.]NJS35418.1 ROK family transcriptional regulator [Brachymonas sp.]
MLPSGDQHVLKQGNKGALLRQICAANGYSRADLVQRVNLTKSTVSLLVRELIDEGWVVEQETGLTDALGRRPTPLALNKDKWVLLGLELAVEQICFVATDLNGEILLSKFEKYTNQDNCALSIEQAGAFAIQCALDLLQVGKEVLGIAIALHGTVNEQTGMLNRCAQMGWHEVNAQLLVRQALANTLFANIPVFVRNEADCCALAEYEFVDQLATQSLAYISVGYGISSGAIVNHELLTGYGGFGGDIGHTTIDLNGQECSCGKKGCAETLIGIRYWNQHSQRQINDHEGDIHLRQSLIEQIAQGHEPVRHAIKIAATSLGALLQNVWTSLASQRIVIGGVALALAPEILDIARTEFYKYASRASLPAPEVIGSRYGELSAAVGSCALVRHRLVNSGLHFFKNHSPQSTISHGLDYPIYATA